MAAKTVPDSRFNGHWRLKSAWPPGTPSFSYQVTDGIGITTACSHKPRDIVGKPAFRLEHVSGNRFRAQHLFLVTYSVGLFSRSADRWFRVSGTINGDTMRFRRGYARCVMVRDPADGTPQSAQATAQDPAASARERAIRPATPLALRRFGRRLLP